MKRQRKELTANVIRERIERTNKRLDSLYVKLQEIQSNNMGFNYSNKNKEVK